MFVPLAANSWNWQGECFFSLDRGGMTEISAPVSTKKSLFEDFSVTYKRLIDGRKSNVADFDCPFSFLTYCLDEKCKVFRSEWLCVDIVCGIYSECREE